MPTPTLGTKGALLDLLIRQGATFGPNNTQLKDAAGAPLDITGCTPRAQIRKTPDSTTVIASAVFTVLDAPNGVFNWEFTAVSTAAITADPVDETQPDSVYVWDMELEYASGRIVPLLYGAVRVFREVTKEVI